MKIKYILLTLALFSFLVISVSAQWSALNSGYAVTTDYHGKNVLPGVLVTATAGTTDANVQNVTFVWKFPNQSIAFIDAEVAVWTNGTTYPENNGHLVFYAKSSYRPTAVGDWGVQAFFNGPEGHLHGPETDIVAIRATSFNVIPEIPIVGTAGATVAMLLGLGLFRSRRKSQI